MGKFYQVGTFKLEGIELYNIQEVENGVTTVILPEEKGRGYVNRWVADDMVRQMNDFQSRIVITERETFEIEQRRAEAWRNGDTEEEAWLALEVAQLNG